MKATIHLIGELEDFEPKFAKLRPDDYKWLMELEKPKGQKHLKMDLKQVIRFLTMFDEVEKIYFEVK